MSARQRSGVRPAPALRGWRSVIVAIIAFATLTSAANAKVIWDSARAPLFRAERLARQQSFIVRRSLAPFMPYMYTPYQLWVPAFGATGWMWWGDTATPFAHSCDDE